MSSTASTATPIGCEPADRVTKSLLGYGVIAGPTYVLVGLAQALTRPGFDLTRHEWSLLANGRFGWIQIANFVVCGAMTLAFAVGLRRALRPGRGATWGPRLVGLYGLGLIAAGVFRADPSLGFPVGTPDGPGALSWHGMLHLVGAMIGFAGLVGACFVVAARYAADGRTAWARASRAVGVVFLLAFAGVASGQGSVAVNLGFTGAVVLAWGWLSAVAIDRYRVVAGR